MLVSLSITVRVNLMSSQLDIQRSLMNARWRFQDAADDVVENLKRRHELPEIIARLLVSRGVEAEAVTSFLKPALRNDFPDPFALTGMEALAKDVAVRVENNKKISVFADFDVDGATSAAVLVRFLRHFGLKPDLYIPDRLNEGYGPNAGALKTLKEQGAETVILCDCGITANDVIAQGKELGLHLVVLDHHEPSGDLPPADHVIDPKRADDTSGFDMLAAVGVTFLTCVAINNKLRERGYFNKTGTPEPPLKDWLDLVALGTVCDIVPLLGPNRLFVREGLKRMRNTQNAGLRALMERAGVRDAVTPYACGFALGPRINAGSRVHKSDLGARLLSTDDYDEARGLAARLEECNGHRKEIQRGMMKQAEAMLNGGAGDDPLVFAHHEDWHAGLAGLVAGRLKEAHNKPAVVIAFARNADGSLEGRGSGRSVPGVNMAQMFQEAQGLGLIVKGGGHAMAGGFTILPEHIPAFREFLRGAVEKQLQGVETMMETAIDGVLTVHGCTPALVKLLEEQVGPFGAGMDEPVFVLPDVKIATTDIVGDGHVRVQISDRGGGGRVKGVAFRAADTALGQALLKGRGRTLHIAGSLKLNRWQGRESAEMHISDAAYGDMQDQPDVAAE